MLHTKFLYLVAALTLTGAATRVDAQGLGDRLKRAAEEAAKRKVERRVEEKAEVATDAALDAAEKRAKEAANSTKPEAASTVAPNAPVVASTNVGKDFTPGTRVLFATDFSRDEIGDFPRAFTLKQGNAEVADIGGTRYLRATSMGKFEVPLAELLPERFTVEFDITPVSGWGQYLYFTDEGDQRTYLIFDLEGGGIEGQNGYRVYANLERAISPNEMVHVQVMADGMYVKVYMNGQRVANAPNADIGRANKLVFQVKADEENPVLLGNLRIAAGGKDLYRELSGTGRVTADGVLFDTNSDRIRAESAPVLKEIGDMLAAHPELRLSIEGHTDDVGSAATNLTLSAKRAEAVRTYLVTKHGVTIDRLTAQGFGATQPIADNGDEAGRQKNRRVDLVKR